VFRYFSIMSIYCLLIFYEKDKKIYSTNTNSTHINGLSNTTDMFETLTHFMPEHMSV
jgi:hypothetical protein